MTSRHHRPFVALLSLIAPFSPMPAAMAAPGHLPVLLVHGIDDNHRTMAPLQRRLKGEGWQDVQAIDLVPNDGRAGIPTLAQQVERAALSLKQRSGSPQIDVVAFSMGALVSRYWLQRLGGTRMTRRFVSISGPHAGTWAAYTRLNRGGEQMRPDSALLRDLAREPDPWGPTQVWAFYTPYDLVIVPPQSSVLPGATVASFPVLLHPWMLSDERVLTAALAALR